MPALIYTSDISYGERYYQSGKTTFPLVDVSTATLLLATDER